MVEREGDIRNSRPCISCVRRPQRGKHEAKSAACMRNGRGILVTSDLNLVRDRSPFYFRMYFRVSTDRL
jgi:hypothetical protein